MIPRVPSLLHSHIRLPPEGSLTLLTSVLTTNTNWLVLLYLQVALSSSSKRPLSNEHLIKRQDEPSTASGNIVIVLVSWMRDWEFWASEARRSLSLDLARHRQEGRFIFLDGLTHLFAPAGTQQGPPGPAGGSTSSSPSSPFSAPYLKNPSLAPVRETIRALQTRQPAARILLILDTPHLLAATAGPRSPPVEPLYSELMALRRSVHAMLVACPADGPLVEGMAPVGCEARALTVRLAHGARMVLGCRGLETGWAGDVSGVLRVTRGAGGLDVGEEVEEGEWLYLIGGDVGGGVKVWRRGEGVG